LLGTPSITSDAFLYTALLAGNVQNTSLVPAEKLTRASLLEEDKIVSLDNAPALTVPNPTSNSAPPCKVIA